MTFLPTAQAQSLEDSIDAELDAASKGLNPEGAALTPNKAAGKKPVVEPTLDGDATAPPAPTHAANELPAAPAQTTAPAAPAAKAGVPPAGAGAPPAANDDLGGELDPGLKSDLEGPDAAVDSKPSAPTKPIVPPKQKTEAAKANAAPAAPEVKAAEPPVELEQPDTSTPATADAQPEVPAEPTAPVAKKAAKEKPPIAPPEPPVELAPEPESPSTTASNGQFDGDEPNHAFEKRLHEIFKVDRTVSDDKWSEMVGSHAEEVYEVQAGDTLWDISTTLFGDGMFWTKIWAENGSIENPHVISPGRGIHFVAGNESSAPTLRVTETPLVTSNTIISSATNKSLTTEIQPEAPVYEDQISSMTADSSDLDEFAIIPRPEIPAGKASRPPSSIPKSFHNDLVKYQGTFDETGLDAPTPKAMTAKATVIPSSYLSEGLPPSLGHINEVEFGDRYASIGQNVFVQLKKPFNIGDRLNVLFVKGTIVDPDHGNLGPVVEVGGTVEIAEALSKGKNIYRAVVVYMINPIRTNSFLTDMPLPRVTVKRQGHHSMADVRIVGAEFDENRQLAGQGSIIYLDGGQRDGIQEGDVLAVQSRRGAHRDSTVYPEYRKTIGLVKVVQSLENVSTAMIIENSEEIRIGDRTGGNLPHGLGGISYETISPLPGKPDAKASAETEESVDEPNAFPETPSTARKELDFD